MAIYQWQQKEVGCNMIDNNMTEEEMMKYLKEEDFLDDFGSE